jgi:hypothetical protein
MQLAEALSVPSSNQRIDTFPGAKEALATFVKGVIQSTRRPWRAQKASGSASEAA